MAYNTVKGGLILHVGLGWREMALSHRKNQLSWYICEPWHIKSSHTLNYSIQIFDSSYNECTHHSLVQKSWPSTQANGSMCQVHANLVCRGHNMDRWKHEIYNILTPFVSGIKGFVPAHCTSHIRVSDYTFHHKNFILCSTNWDKLWKPFTRRPQKY
jgi:hypothetical protein